MPVFIDTNVILDVITDDSRWNQWASTAINQRQSSGLFINPLVYAELCTGAESIEEADRITSLLKLNHLNLPHAALFFAAKAFRQYRSKGGTQTSPLPDFFIGGHAKALGYPILTRDVKRYQTYFPEVPLITP